MPIIENKLTGRLCRFIEYEVMPWGRRVIMEELQSGCRSVATEQYVQPYAGVVVDFERRV